MVEIAGGDQHGCARIDADDDGVGERLECFGFNSVGQLGSLGAHVMPTPTEIRFED